MSKSTYICSRHLAHSVCYISEYVMYRHVRILLSPPPPPPPPPPSSYLLTVNH